MDLYDADEATALFVQLYTALHDDRDDITAMCRSLEEQGVDVNALVATGKKIFADSKKSKTQEE